MVPTTIGAVAVFLLLIAPGLAFELLRQRARPARVDSAFVEISRVLLAGTVITGFVVLVLGLARAVNPNGVVDVAALIRAGTAYWSANLPLIGWSAAAHLVLALLIAWLAEDVLAGRRTSVLTTDSTWHVLFHRIAPPGTRAFLSVQLKDGTTYTGYQAEYSTDLEPAKRDVTLAQPIQARVPGATKMERLPDSWQRMWIRGDEIATMAVSYVGTPVTVSAPPKPLVLFERHKRWVAVAGVVAVLVALLTVG